MSSIFNTEKEKDEFIQNLRDEYLELETKTNGPECSLFVSDAGDGNVVIHEVTDTAGLNYADDKYEEQHVWIDVDKIPDVIAALEKIYKGRK